MLSSVCTSSDHDFVKNDFYLMHFHVKTPYKNTVVPGGGYIFYICTHKIYRNSTNRNIASYFIEI